MVIFSICNTLDDPRVSELVVVVVFEEELKLERAQVASVQKGYGSHRLKLTDWLDDKMLTLNVVVDANTKCYRFLLC